MRKPVIAGQCLAPVTAFVCAAAQALMAGVVSMLAVLV